MWITGTIILGLLALVLLGLYIKSNRTIHNMLTSSNAELENLRTTNARLEEQTSSLSLSAEELKLQLSQRQESFEKEQALRIEAETKLANANEVIKAEQSLLEKAQDTFKSLASEVLDGSNKNFLELAKTTLEKQSIQSIGDVDKRKQAIEELVKPLSESLKAYQSNISDMELAREKTHGFLESELKKVSQSHESLSQTTTALKDALKKPHIRGRWGEVQLKNCIELAGMSEHCDVSFQDSTTTTEGNQLRPDMVVRMPGDRKVIVDSKTPIEAFLSSLESTTEDERQLEMVRHGKHVKKHIQDLSTKDYAKNIKNSADFTVMFLPNESFLYAAIEVEPDLVEYALEKKILIATPPTLIGLLKVIRYGWNEQKLTDNALKISEAGKELHKRVCDFMDAYMSIGKHLDKAKEEYDKGTTRLESRVLVQTKRLEKLGAKSKKSLPVEFHTDDELGHAIDVTEGTPQLT